MIYRPEQKQGEGKSEDLNAFYTRKQRVKHNQFDCEAEVLHDADRDAEQNASRWEGAGPKKTSGPGWKEKSSTIWEDEAWKDKDQGRGS
jgi:hypothetical protein